MDAKAIIRKKLRVLICAIVSLVALGSAPAVQALEQVTWQYFYPVSGGGTWMIVQTGTVAPRNLYWISNPTPLMMQAINMAYQMGTDVADFGVPPAYSFTHFTLDRSADYDLIEGGAPYLIAVSNQVGSWGYGGFDASSSHINVKYLLGDPCRPNGVCPDSSIYLYGTSGFPTVYSIQSAVLGAFATGKYSGVPKNSTNPTAFLRDWTW